MPTDGRLSYDEGVWVGYRGFAARRAPAPAYWFGEGLGYGDWEYGEAAVSRSLADGLRVTVELANVSRRDSREVVQVYLKPDSADLPVALLGWATIELGAGRSGTVEVVCDSRAASFDSRGTVLVARGLGDLRCEEVLESPA